MTEDAGSQSYAFGPFVLIPARQRLLHGEVPVRIGSRALDILTALAERAGELVSKRELMASVWPDTVVDESNLKVNMAALRRVLGDGGPDDARYIATVTGRGYKLIAPVTATSASIDAQPDPPQGAAPPAPPAVRRHNLPTGTTRVIGRADAIDAIRRDFHVSRLVTIVGPGGIGKTTVALAVAEQEMGAYAEGVWLVDLTLVTDARLVPGAIAAILGIAGSSAGVLDMLCASLRERALLLVLDSCEHVIDASAACVSQILAAAAGVKILVTSREPLELNGERVRRLPGLATPPSSEQLGAQEALTFPAVQLFVDRATDRLDAFKLGDADAPLVAEICRKLDGLALAIELAATRIDAFGVKGLLKQLDDRFRLLVGRRSGPERHRTLTATLGWSYGLLAEDEAAVLRAVSAFAGVFDIEGAAAVAAMDSARTADALAQLSAKSLLITDLDSDGIAYRFLESTRSYCLDKLRSSGEEQQVRQRHAEHTHATLERAAREWARSPADAWEAAYRRVLGDLRAALLWTGQTAPDGPLAIRLTVDGLQLWSHFSLTEECHVHVSHAVDELDAAGLSGTAFEMKLRLWLGGSSMFTRGFRHKAMEALRRALEIAVQIGDTDYRLRCLMMMGIYELFTGEHEAGMRTLQGFAAAAAEGDPTVMPEGDVHMGIADLFLGRLHASRQRLESLGQRDLRYFGSYAVRYLSDPLILVHAVLSHAEWLTGSPDTALRTATRAIDQARQTKHHLSLNNILSYACPVYYWTGAWEECERCVSMLEENVARHGLVARRPVADFYRAALACTQGGATPHAISLLRRAVEAFRDINHLARLPYYLSVLADALAQGGQLDEAEATIRTALDIAHARSERWCLPEVLRIGASIATIRGRLDEASASLTAAIAVSEETGALAWRLRAATDLAALLQAGGKCGEALHVLLPVRAAFKEGDATRDLVRASARIDELRD